MKKRMLVMLFVLSVFFFTGCNKKEDVAVDVESFPNKSIEIIVAYKAGGGTDVGARVLSTEAEKIIGKPVVIKNIEGSDGEVGYTTLANSKPDGYTIGFINLPTFVSLTLERNTKYSIDDVVPILNHVYDSGVLVVKSDSKIKTLEDFIDYAKKNPNDITISNNGTGASNHIGAAHFAHEANIDVTHVPFGGSTDMLAALRGGHVDASVAKISEVADLVKSGELRILASFTEERLHSLPEVPTLKEKGYDILFGSARALVAPKDTPQEIIDKLHNYFKEALESEEHLKRAANAELPIKYMSPEDLEKYIQDEKVYLEEMSKLLNING